MFEIQSSNENNIESLSAIKAKTSLMTTTSFGENYSTKGEYYLRMLHFVCAPQIELRQKVHENLWPIICFLYRCINVSLFR